MKRSFPWFFATQFAGAFNDNVFKNILVLGFTYGHFSMLGLKPLMLVSLAQAFFILPFFLFSALAGQLADRYSKTLLVRRVKELEILIMGLASLGFVLNSTPVLMGTLFLMGTQSAFFGPAKYSMLPELVREKELASANAWVELGTFAAILLGTLVGGYLGGEAPRAYLFSLWIIGLACLGVLVSRGIHVLPARAPQLRITLNPIAPVMQSWRSMRGDMQLCVAMLGVSWFWFYGLAILTLLPTLCTQVFHVASKVSTLALALFCFGIGAGSWLGAWIFRQPKAALWMKVAVLGLALFTLHLAWLVSAWPTPALEADFLELALFLRLPMAWQVCLSWLMIAFCGGAFVVPLYTQMQHRAEVSMRSRIIASNNILNALAMVIAALMIMLFHRWHVSFTNILICIAASSVIVLLMLLKVVGNGAKQRA